MKRRGSTGKRLPVLIEVKLSPEETKSGVEPESEEAARLLERLPDLQSSGNARADDHCAVGRGGRCDAGVLSQFAGVARSVGGGASRTEFRCAVDGDEWRFCAGELQKARHAFALERRCLASAAPRATEHGVMMPLRHRKE